MAKLYAKHQQQPVTLNDFSGGLNTLVSSDMLQDNELKTAENFESDTRTGRFKVVDGVEKLFENNQGITAIFYDEDRQQMLYRSSHSLYRLDVSFSDMGKPVLSDTPVKIGDLSGTKKVGFVKWEREILITSGGRLQIYDGTSITEADSPNADMAITRFGRVVIFNSGSDYLYYSAVGDATDWVDDTDVDSSAKSVQIGYKDGGEITGIAPLSSDICVFKSNGSLYRITNEYPDWVVSEVSRNAHCCNSKTVMQCGNDVYYTGRNGFCNVSTVQEYGSVKTAEAGRKINKLLTQLLDLNTCQMWYVPNKDQILIQPSKTDYNYIFIYNYQLGSFTMRRTAKIWNDMCRYNQFDFVCADDCIGLLDMSCPTEFGLEMYACLETRSYTSNDWFLIKRVWLELGAITKGYGKFTVGKLQIDINFPSSNDVVLTDEDIACEDIDGLGNTDGDEDRYTKRCNMRRKNFNFMLEIFSGTAELKKVSAVVTEV